ncbi:Aste57867_7693 [Aphanomyces stellatus]|uniref:Aste57867_7693 protein n=1 Tax=Aphanomyces stellatus TaxID=120398 RepID=A0A485KIN7_9STRA|nr:hypothetical protein As57867_007664 [Aphanomyces stellatus]VFT84596.1 Aste57867_7693 [Aphanomyces stellatus]
MPRAVWPVAGMTRATFDAAFAAAAMPHAEAPCMGLFVAAIAAAALLEMGRAMTRAKVAHAAVHGTSFGLALGFSAMFDAELARIDLVLAILDQAERPMAVKGTLPRAIEYLVDTVVEETLHRWAGNEKVMARL